MTNEIEQLPEEGKQSNRIGNAALVIQVINGLDLLASALGIVPPGIIPSVANGIITIVAGATQFWSKKQTVKVALHTPPPRKL